MHLAWISIAAAGLGPADVLVLSNAQVPESVALGVAYQDARQLPAGHHCQIPDVDGEALELTLEQAQALRVHLDACLQALPDPEEIDALLLVRGLPVRVAISGGSVSLQAFLQVHDLESGGSLIQGQAGSSFGVRSPIYPFARWQGEQAFDHDQMSYYAATLALSEAEPWPGAFERQSAGSFPGFDFNGQLFVVSRLDGFDYGDAQALIERSVASDAQVPSGEVLCLAGSGARAPRDPECELLSRLLPDLVSWQSPFDGALVAEDLASLMTGTADFKSADLSFQPGAFVGNLTSYGAHPNNFCEGEGCPSEQQTSIARFIRAGASAAHGTVDEPYNHCFPNASLLAMLVSGYSYGEASLYSQQFLYWKNLYLGDPLMAPWAERPVVEAPLSWPAGQAVELVASHGQGIAELRVFVNGERVQTLAGEEPFFIPSGEIGETQALLIVALAQDVDLEGFPVQPGVQGWWSGTVTVEEPELVDTMDSGAPGPEPGCGGCGGSGGGLWILALLALRSVRRR